MNQLYITQKAKCNTVNFDNAGIVKLPLTAELDICSGKNEHKTSTGVEPQHGERGGERRERKKNNKDLLSN